MDASAALKMAVNSRCKVAYLMATSPWPMTDASSAPAYTSHMKYFRMPMFGAAALHHTACCRFFIRLVRYVRCQTSICLSHLRLTAM